MKQKGLTLLELLITIAIMGAVFAVGSRGGLGSWGTKKTAQNTVKELRDEIKTLRNHAMSKNTTSRMVLINTSDVYTITTYTSTTPTMTCSSAGTWNVVINAREIEVADSYEITGGGMINTCFYRDGSSSGGSFVVAPQSGATGTTTTLDVTISTGFIDVTES